jgi:hypothetical protein
LRNHRFAGRYLFEPVETRVIAARPQIGLLLLVRLPKNPPYILWQEELTDYPRFMNSIAFVVSHLSVTNCGYLTYFTLRQQQH